ncbi:MAG: hypothetical protein E7639_01135 [Ruminococcaceae bacterium]|nr:hypothetical protein [Oscillospiraceae bacterium]
MLKAGFAKVDITPPFGTPIAGYFRERQTKGVLDPLSLCCLALEADEEKMLIITADFLGIEMARCREMAASIEARTGIPAASVIIQALHPHTSPVITTKPGLNYTYQGTYFDMIMLKVGDVAELALADLEEATMAIAAGETAEQISFVRRYYMKDGTVKTNPGFNRSADIVAPCDEPDNGVSLLRFRRAKGDIALVNFACHPDVIGGELVSTDWPGFVRRYVEADHPGTSCIFCNGYQGDSNHHNFISGVRRGGYEHSKHMGRVIADCVKGLWEQATPTEVTSIGTKCKTVYTRTCTDDLDHYDELKAFYDAYRAGTLGYDPPMNEVVRATRLVDVVSGPILKSIPITIAHIGDVILAGIGGEPFTYYIRAVRAFCPDKMLLSMCLTNGNEGYFPTEKAFAEGGYETAYSPFTPAIENEILSTIDKLIKAQ